MASQSIAARTAVHVTAFAIEGKVHLEGKEACAGDLPLRAFAFGANGRFIGAGDVSDDGMFAISAELKQPEDVEVLVGPAVEPDLVRQAEPPVQRFTAKEWTRVEPGFRLTPKFELARRVWWPWSPTRVCVRGRVRKAMGDRPACPVPFAKVEVFDVDREGCLWPLLQPRLPKLYDKPVIRLPELLKIPPIPDPIGPIANLGSRMQHTAFNPQALLSISEQVGFNPQPDPSATPFAHAQSVRVGEARMLSDDVATRVQDLTVTSRIAPWLTWPGCFYSKARVCETETDCDGRFRCCFSWWPFHIRNGRLRFDARPDIVLKVTQTIGTTTRVIYLDPYTSTRWDSWGAYIELMLDDEDVACGGGCTPQPVGTTTHFVRVGNDEVYQINQATGEYDLTRPGLGGTTNHMAYGGALNLHAVFGDSLTAAAPLHYYRLSINGPTTGGQWKEIKNKLVDTRVHKVTHHSEDHDLGPFTIGPTHNLYAIRDTATYHWYNQDWIGTWHTSWGGDLDTFVPDHGLYTVRLEVFDNAGTQLTSASVDYRDGTAIPPALLPAMTDACYLVMQVDNVAPTVSLTFPSVVNGCGVVPVAMTPFDITAHVSQANGRLNDWGLRYVKGLNIGSGALADPPAAPTGMAVPVNQAVSSDPMTAGLAGTCAFSLTIGATAHIRNGYGLIYHVSQNYALAVDACKKATAPA